MPWLILQPLIMAPSRRPALSAISFVLGLLVLLLGAAAARQEAPVLAGHQAIKVLKMAGAHVPAFHKLAAHHDYKHPVQPARKHHHRSRAHRTAVAKVAVPLGYRLQRVALAYKEHPASPLASVYPYAYYREITPPPPKDC